MKRNFSLLASISLLAFSPLSFAETSLKKVIDPTLGAHFNEMNQLVINANSDNKAKNFTIRQVLGKDGAIHSVEEQRFDTGSQNYFVEFSNSSLINFQRTINDTERYVSKNLLSIVQQKKSQILSHYQRIKSQQTSFIQQMNAQFINVEVVRQFSKTINSVVIKADKKSIEKIALYPNVKRVVKENRFKKTLVESVPLINAPSVWETKDDNDAFIKGDGVTVAIIDTGIDYTHPDLGGCLGAECKVIAGWDFVNNDADPMDGDGHGTHVAGIVAGESENYTGVAPNAKLYAIKVLSDEGWGTNTDIIAGIEYAVDPDGDPLTDDGVDIINMSLGGTGERDGPLSIATDAAVKAGVIVVVAAGNDGNYGAINTTSPANAVKAITVASSTKEDGISSFSSKSILESNTAIKPEITAPGSDITSSYLSHETSSLSGTSMASPHVAGAIALLKQAKPALTTQQAKELLSASAVDIGADPLAQGPGRMDIFAAFDVDTVIPEGALNFGIVDKDADVWSSDATFTIKNLSELEQTYQISLSDNTIETAVVSFDKTEVVIPALGQVEIKVNIAINDVASFPTANHEAGIHYADIHVTNGTKVNRIPFAFQHANYLTVTNESVFSAYLWISSVEKYRSIPNVRLSPNESQKVMLQHESIIIETEFNNLTSDDYPELIPENSIGTGITIHKVDVEGETEFIVSSDSLKHVLGVKSLKNKFGESAPLSDINSESMTLSIEGPQSTSSTFSSYDDHRYYVLGDVTDYVKIQYGNLLTLEQSEPNTDGYYYHGWYESNKLPIEKASFDIDFSSEAYFSVAFNEDLFTENSVISLEQVSTINSLDTDIKKINIFTHTSDEVRDSGIAVSLINKIFDEGGNSNQELIASSSGRLSLNSELSLNQLEYFSWDNNIVRTIPNKHLELSAGGTYWNGRISNSEGIITLRDDTWGGYKNFVSDISGFNYAGLNSQYTFICNEEALTPAPIEIREFENSEIELPEVDCTSLLFEVNYDSYLNQSKYTSSLLFPIYEANYIYPPLAVALFEGEQQVFDQTVDKIDARIEFSYAWSESFGTTLFIQLDGQEWQELTFYEKDNATLVVELSQIPDSHIANIKIENDDYNGGKVVQTFNGFFNFGLGTGDENDADNDGITNDVDTDNDNDGVLDIDDLFPYNSLESADFDGDGIGNNADTDDDNDGTLDEEDDFPLDASEQFDTDLDGIGNNADTDDDNDGVLDAEDFFPLDETEQYDTDLDGIGNNADSDDDNDFVTDGDDAFPLDASEQFDFDMDGIGDNADLDDDNDGVNDTDDLYPFNATESVDTDGDGIGNNADTDDDNDGVTDENDFYPLDASRSVQAVITTPAGKSSSGGGGGSTGNYFILFMISVILIRKRLTYSQSK